MKKLLAALLFAPSFVMAESFSMPNKNGGEIVITDRDCVVKGKNYAPLKEAFSHWSGGYLEGCWYLEDNMIKIIWQTSGGGAERRAYRIEDFERKSGRSPRS